MTTAVRSLPDGIGSRLTLCVDPYRDARHDRAGPRQRAARLHDTDRTKGGVLVGEVEDLQTSGDHASVPDAGDQLHHRAPCVETGLRRPVLVHKYRGQAGVDAVRRLHLVDEPSRGGHGAVLIHEPVTVVVQTVRTGFARCCRSGNAALEDTAYAPVYGTCADAGPAAEDAEPIIYETVAVIVQTVAGLGRRGHGGYVALNAVRHGVAEQGPTPEAHSEPTVVADDPHEATRGVARAGAGVRHVRDDVRTTAVDHACVHRPGVRHTRIPREEPTSVLLEVHDGEVTILNVEARDEEDTSGPRRSHIHLNLVARCLVEHPDLPARDGQATALIRDADNGHTVDEHPELEPTDGLDIPRDEDTPLDGVPRPHVGAGVERGRYGVDLPHLDVPAQPRCRDHDVPTVAVADDHGTRVGDAGIHRARIHGTAVGHAGVRDADVGTCIGGGGVGSRGVSRGRVAHEHGTAVGHVRVRSDVRGRNGRIGHGSGVGGGRAGVVGRATHPDDQARAPSPIHARLHTVTSVRACARTDLAHDVAERGVGARGHLDRRRRGWVS